MKNHLTRLKDMEQLKRHLLEHLITTDVKQIHILKILILSLEGFDKDILAFREQEQAFFDESNSQNMEFDELIQQYNNEAVKENAQDSAQSIDQKLDNIQKDEKLSANDYKKAKEVAKNFKVDKDLSSFGLDGGIDLSDINDEDW